MGFHGMINNLAFGVLILEKEKEDGCMFSPFE
jgi:hypothetical protein